MSSLPIEKRFAILSEIARAQHFAWREAVGDVCPEVDPGEVVRRMWEIVGKQTGASYARHLDPSEPVAPQVAASVAWSSQCMGEDAEVEAGATGDEAFVRHAACPWRDWHQRLGLEAEDRPGCDCWFETSVAEVNARLGTRLQVETLEALPDGDDSCLRRFWIATPGGGL